LYFGCLLHNQTFIKNDHLKKKKSSKQPYAALQYILLTPEKCFTVETSSIFSHHAAMSPFLGKVVTHCPFLGTKPELSIEKAQHRNCNI